MMLEQHSLRLQHMRKRKKKRSPVPRINPVVTSNSATVATEHTQLRNGLRRDREIRKHAQEYSKQTRDLITCTVYVHTESGDTPRQRYRNCWFGFCVKRAPSGHTSTSERWNGTQQGDTAHRSGHRTKGAYISWYAAMLLRSQAARRLTMHTEQRNAHAASTRSSSWVNTSQLRPMRCCCATCVHIVALWSFNNTTVVQIMCNTCVIRRCTTINYGGNSTSSQANTTECKRFSDRRRRRRRPL